MQAFANKLNIFMISSMVGIQICKNIWVLTTFEKTQKCPVTRTKIKMGVWKMFLTLPDRARRGESNEV